MARIGCCASQINGPKAEYAMCHQVSVVHAAPSFHRQDSARFSFGAVEFPFGVGPRIRDTYASDRRLAGAWYGIDLSGGREIEADHRLLLVQTYGG
jgi:hypothetical protein